jgi:hypothetical protein
MDDKTAMGCYGDCATCDAAEMCPAYVAPPPPPPDPDGCRVPLIV